MNTTEKVKTYGSKGFREKFLGAQNPVHQFFKSKSERFFCLKLEEMTRLQHPVPASKHNCNTILFITEGVHLIKIGYEQYQTNPNEIIVIPAGQIFSIEHIHDKHIGFICQFHPDFLIGKYGNSEAINAFDFLKIGGTPKITVLEKNASFIFNLLNRLQLEYAEHGLNNLDLIQSYVMALLCEMNKNMEKTPKSGTAAAVITIKFKELIYANITHQQVSYYASLLNVTPNHLNKSVKLITGKSATQWIEETIILEAKYLLYQTTLLVSEIALQVGHEDQSYFSRFFKKHEGITPVQYRKMIHKS
jgi:AraC family transcriptional activator of pobA